MSVHRNAVLILVLATALWGLSFPLGKAAGAASQAVAPDVSIWFASSHMIALRFLVAAALLAALFRGRVLQIGRAELVHGCVLGLFTGGGLVLQISGLLLVPASVSAFLTQAGIVAVPFLVAWHTGRWPSVRILPAFVLMLAGVAILAEVDWAALRVGYGEALTLAASLLFAGQVAWLEREDYARTRPLAVTLVMFLAIGIVFLGITLATAPALATAAAIAAAPGYAVPVVGIAVFCTVCSFTMMNVHQPRVSATEAGIIYSAEPVYATAFALFLPGLLAAAFGGDYRNEALHTTLFVGGGLILAANILVQLKPLQRLGWAK